MPDPVTLRAASGLPTEPPALGASTLVLIDCQNTYTRGPLELDGVQAALDQAEEPLDRARSAGIPVIHVQHDAGPGSAYDVRAESGAIVDRVAPGRANRRSSGTSPTPSPARTCTPCSASSPGDRCCSPG